jgi:hypothetical protein
MGDIICPECGIEDITDDVKAFAMLDNGSVYMVCMGCYFALGGTEDNERPGLNEISCNETWNYTTKRHNVVMRRSDR